MSVKSTLSVALTILALGVAPAAFAQSDSGMSATGTHSDWGTGQGALYYDANGGLHYGETNPHTVARRTGTRGVDAFAQAPAQRPVFSGVRGSMQSPSSLNYEPDLRSH